MLGDQRQAEDELQHEVAIARGVEAVGRHVVEAQPPGDVVAIDRQAGAGQGRGAQASSTLARRRQSASRCRSRSNFSQ